MEYEITDIVPGKKEDDIIVTVSYWYGDFDRGLGKPADFIEEHLIGDIPVSRPIVNSVGQYMGVDGVWITPWELVDDEWVPVVPDMADVQHEDIDVMPFIEGPIETVAEEVKRNRPSGVSRIDDKMKKPATRKAAALAKRNVVREQIGRRKRVT